MRRLLDVVGFTGHLEARVSSLSVAQRHLLELAKAFAAQPKLLILDEPTAPLSQESVDLLFGRVRDLAARGHGGRLHHAPPRRGPRDRRPRHRPARRPAARHLVRRRHLRRRAARAHHRAHARVDLPAEARARRDDEELLLPSRGSSGRRLLRHLLQPRAAARSWASRASSATASRRSSAPSPASTARRRAPSTSAARTSPAARCCDELGLHAGGPPHRGPDDVGLSVRENAALTALDRLKAARFVSRRRELDARRARARRTLAVKAPSLEAPVSSLSGGNQQKVVMARAMLSEPAILSRTSRRRASTSAPAPRSTASSARSSDRGVPVVVASSDAQELEGLCDRVIVMSRGHAVETLEGDAVNEERIIHAAVSATTQPREGRRDARGGSTRARAGSSRATTRRSSILAAVMIALGVYVYSAERPVLLRLQHHVGDVRRAPRSASSRSARRSRCCWAASTSRWGRSPASWSSSGRSSSSTSTRPAVWLFGIALMLGVRGRRRPLSTGSLIRYGKFTPVAATLVTYIALGGFGLRAARRAGRLHHGDVTDLISTKVGPVPWPSSCSSLVALGARARGCADPVGPAAARGRVGRGVGAACRRARQPHRAARLRRRVSLLTFLGAIVLLAQLGVGDPAQGRATP